MIERQMLLPAMPLAHLVIACCASSVTLSVMIARYVLITLESTECSSNCQYVDIESLETIFCSRKNNDLAILHINIRSLNLNLQLFENMILNCLSSKPDIICVSETKLKPSSSIDNLDIPGLLE